MIESKKGEIEKQSEELLKSPYIFEFAGLKENKNYLESDLEKSLLNHLTEFLLELGRGFSFVASKQRLKTEILLSRFNILQSFGEMFCYCRFKNW